MIIGLIIAWAWVSLLVFALAVVRKETPLVDESHSRTDNGRIGASLPWCPPEDE